MRRLAFALLLVGATVGAAPTPDLKVVQTKAQAGDADAEFQLAEAYRAGRGGLDADAETAIMWYRRAANQGHVRASEELGFALFAHGDRREAMPYIEKAAARGEVRAFYLLGTAHFNGDFATRDWPLAYAQTTRAATAGLPAAIKNLALMDHYLLPADHAKADQILATLPAVRAPVSAAAAAAIQPAAPLATGSAQAPSPAAKPAKLAAKVTTPARATSPANGAWKAQLGAFGTADRARDRWKSLVAKVSRLGDYNQHIVAAGAVQRLQAAGIASKNDAAALCKDVRAAGGDCFLVAP